MIKIGMIGLNEGNGHPYSFSAVFNGYDEKILQEECPFVLIREYLPREHGNKIFIENAKVTHIWAQNRKIAESVARVSKIPNIVDKPEELIGKVDAIILARDDVENHWRMAEPFLKTRMPIYIDKLLAHNEEDLNKFIQMAGDGYPIMSGSSSRYTRNIEKAKEELDIRKVKTIHGVSRCIWLRYASHLLDGICYLFGTDIETVQNIGIKRFDIVHIHYRSGLNVVLQVIENLALPIEFTCYSAMASSLEDDSSKNKKIAILKEGHYTVPFTDFFYSYRQMMIKFVGMVETNKQPIAFEEIVKIAKIIIAGEISRRQGNRVVHIEEV